MLSKPLAVATLVALLSMPLLASAQGQGPAQPAQDRPIVVIDTSAGPITVQLEPARAPRTVENFLQYVDAGFYDNTVFHRVIPEFMIQGGGFAADLKEKETRGPVKNESRAVSPRALSNARGTIAMARTRDPDSATAQFFINLVDNSRLDTYGGGYTAFGSVIEGMDVVGKIAQVPTGRSEATVSTGQGGESEKTVLADVPTQTILIKSVKRRQAGPEAEGTTEAPPGAQ